MTFKEMEALTEYQKEIFMTKEDGKDLEFRLNLKLDKIQNTLDSVFKITKNHGDELKILNSRMKSTEDWIDRAAPIVGVPFNH